MEGNDQEFDISKLGALVSKTDLQGTIIEVNESFVIASGYSKQELIGQSHNIVRHQDVPKSVFKDLWGTLKQGKPWVQTLKNQRKDGSYYWVRSNVTPMYQNGRVVGYLSVRTPVMVADQQSAIQLYQRLSQGKSRLKNGFEVSWMQRLCVFHKIHPINLMLVMIGLLGVLSSVIQAGLVQLPSEFVVFISVLFFLYAWAGRQYAFKRLGGAKRLIDKMREGDFTGQVNHLGNHSLSRLMSAVKMMQTQLGAMYDDSQEKLHASLRLKSALDSASTNMMMVDQSGKVIYLNDQLQNYLQRNCSQIQSVFPHFEPKNMVGKVLSSICHTAFFQNLTQAKVSEENIGGLQISLSVIPVKDFEQQTIGSVIEWQDLTQQRLIERELALTLKMASIGHTDLHIDTQNLTGFYLDTSNNINSLLSELNAIIESMVYVMTKLAVGDVTARVEKNLQGSLAAMKGATNVSLDNLSSIVLYTKRQQKRYKVRQMSLLKRLMSYLNALNRLQRQ